MMVDDGELLWLKGSGRYKSDVGMLLSTSKLLS